MKVDEFEKLRIGDIVTHVSTGTSYVVTECLGEGYVATRTLLINNPIEWKKFRREIDETHRNL